LSVMSPDKLWESSWINQGRLLPRHSSPPFIVLNPFDVIQCIQLIIYRHWAMVQHKYSAWYKN
jgi:hypothetical protein